MVPNLAPNARGPDALACEKFILVCVERSFSSTCVRTSSNVKSIRLLIAALDRNSFDNYLLVAKVDY